MRFEVFFFFSGWATAGSLGSFCLILFRLLVGFFVGQAGLKAGVCSYVVCFLLGVV